MPGPSPHHLLVSGGPGPAHRSQEPGVSALLGGWVKRWCCCGDEGWGESVVMNYWCGHWPQCLWVPIQLAFGLAFGFSR